ncbi:MAG: AAA family ATPase [Bdellovibrionota bacterium]
MNELFSMKEPDTNWTLDGVLPTSGLSIIAGKPKTGKSTFMRCLTMAVQAGAPFMDRSTKLGPVLYFALEEKATEVRKHFESLGADGHEEVRFYFGKPPGNRVQFLQTQIEEWNPSLIIIDPVFRFFEVHDCNDYQEVNRVLTDLMDVARLTEAHIMCSHHMNKGGKGDADGILGSTAIFGGVDTALMLMRNGEHRTLATTQRYGQDMPETILRFDPQTRHILGTSTKDEWSAASLRQSILTIVKELGSCTEATILTVTKGRSEDLKRELRVLVESGHVQRHGSGFKGQPFSYNLPEFAGPHLGTPKAGPAFMPVEL